jgi:hypothetical protein
MDGAGSVTAWNEITSYRQVVTQETPGVPGDAAPGDQFGASLAFSQPRSGQDQGLPREVAVGAPRDDVGAVQDAGSVTVLPDVPFAGLRGGQPALTQETPGFAGSAETGDRFGYSVAFRPGRFNGSTLAIGVPYEDVGSVVDAGLVQIATTGSDGGADPVTAYTENTAGTPGQVTRGNRFGLAVAGMRGLAESVVAVSSPYQGAGSVFVASDHGEVRSWVPGRGGIPTSSGRFGWSISGLQNQRS